MRCGAQRHRAAAGPGPALTGEVKRAYGIHPYAPLILFIGRLVYQKGPDLFIEALRKVCRERWDAKVIVAGDGGMRQYLQDRAP